MGKVSASLLRGLLGSRSGKKLCQPLDEEGGIGEAHEARESV